MGIQDDHTFDQLPASLGRSAQFISPNVVTFSSTINACAEGGQWDRPLMRCAIEQSSGFSVLESRVTETQKHDDPGWAPVLEPTWVNERIEWWLLEACNMGWVIRGGAAWGSVASGAQDTLRFDCVVPPLTPRQRDGDSG